MYRCPEIPKSHNALVAKDIMNCGAYTAGRNECQGKKEKERKRKKNDLRLD
jgi:hypothetical protein